MSKKQLKVKNGIAQPLGKGYYLMNGPSHEQGGIDIGKNLEVEGGEIVKLNPKSIKVLSNAKIMGDMTPAEYALGGLKDGTFEDKYNKGFKYQEKFKDINELNDDGTKKAKLGKEQSIKNETKGTYVDKLIANYITKNVNKLGKQEFIKRLHDNLIPFGYGEGVIGTVRRIYNAVNKNKQEEEVKGQLPGKWNRKMLEDSGVMDIYGEYLGIPKENRYFSNSYVENSKYKPTTSIDENITYKTLYPLPEKLKNNIINEGMKLKLGEIKESPIQDEAFNTYTISRGKDDKGEYISFYDKWDLNPTRGTEGSKFLRMFSSGDDQFVNLGIAKPLEFYDRIYLNDINKKQLGGQMKKKYRIGGTVNVPPTGEKIKAKYGLRDKLVNDFLNQTIDEINSTDYSTEFGLPSVSFTTPRLKVNDISSIVVPDGYYKTKNGAIFKDFENKNTNRLGLTTGDWINAGVNIGGALINLASRHSLPQKAIKYKSPIPLTAIKSKTKININPQLREIDKTINKYTDTINKNTASSQVSLNRLRDLNLNRLDMINKLYGQKENQETALINQDNRNLQNIINQNIQAQNIIDQKNLENEIQTTNLNRLERADAITDFIQNIAQTTGNVLSNVEKRKQFDKNLITMGLSYPNLNIDELLKVIGLR